MTTTGTRAWCQYGTYDKTDSSDDNADNADTTGSSPLFYNLLPLLVQRRIPKLKSLKKALSNYDQRARSSRSLSRESIMSTTPPPSYRSNPAERGSLDEASGLSFRFFDRNSEPPSRSSTSGTSTPAYLDESHSGVQWKYADPGFALLSLSSQEASTLSRSHRLVRRQYIDGVACCLRGLPSDLTLEEELSLREALPSTFQPDSITDSEIIIRPDPRSDLTYSSCTAAEPSTLHNFIASATVQVFLFIAFLTPYINLLIRSAYAFDRKHKISDRILAGGVVAADVVARQTLVIAQEICGWNQGKVGEAIRGVGTYVVQGVGGGVVKGVGEGMVAARRRREEEEGERRDRVSEVADGKRCTCS